VTEPTDPQPTPAPPPGQKAHEHSIRLVVTLIAGVVAGVAAAIGWRPLYAPLVGWTVSCVVYLTWVWAAIWRMNGHETAHHAVMEDPGRRIVDALLLLCSISLQVDLVLVLSASKATGGQSRWIALLGLASVVASWALVHTLYTLRYAHLYHHLGGGIDFNRDGYRPTYQDFAYFAFNLGMTFQVSDTTVSEPAIRVTTLRHNLLSYMFTTLVLANVINVIVGILP